MPTTRSIAAGPDSSPQRQDEVGAVHDELRRQILHNELVAGARVNQAVIARDLNVSRGPVREALRMLQREGLVEHEHQHQMRVSSVSLADLEQLYAMRIVLESLAVGLTVPTLTVESVSRLEVLLAEMDRYADAGDIDGWDKLHTQFHTLLTSHAGDRISRELLNYSEHSARYRRLYVHGEPLALSQGGRDHSEILQAVRGGDAALAASLHALHLGKAALTVAAIVDPGHNPTTIRAAIRMAAPTHER